MALERGTEKSGGAPTFWAHVHLLVSAAGSTDRRNLEFGSKIVQRGSGGAEGGKK